MNLWILLLLFAVFLLYVMAQNRQLDAMVQQYKENKRHKKVADGIEMMGQQGKQLWLRLHGQQPPESLSAVEPTALRAWVRQSPLVDAATETWFCALDDNKLLVVRDFATEFGHHMGFELGWIVHEQLPDGLDETLSGVLAHYLASCRLLLSSQAEIYAFAETLPTDREAVAHQQNGHVER